ADVVLAARRSRCPGGGARQVLLPAWCLSRRADEGAVIGSALQAAAAGAGHRTIAAGLGRPASTVRGWLRRFAARAEAVRAFFTVLLARTSPDPVMPAGAAGPEAVPLVGMSKAEEEEQARLERARAIGLFRYMLIREAADPALSTRQRGKLVRAIAAREHADPSGRPVRLTRWTLDRWIRLWQQGGFDALVPAPRQCQPRTPPEVMELAVAMKKENPARTAAQVQRILRAQGGWAPDETTIQRMFRRTGLTALTPAADAPAFGRWEAARPNEIWTGDAMHPIRLQGRKALLFGFVGDHSRAVMAARFGFAEDTIRLAAALR